jgi:hypothetical protein
LVSKQSFSERNISYFRNEKLIEIAQRGDCLKPRPLRADGRPTCRGGRVFDEDVVHLHMRTGCRRRAIAVPLPGTPRKGLFHETITGLRGYAPDSRQLFPPISPDFISTISKGINIKQISEEIRGKSWRLNGAYPCTNFCACPASLEPKPCAREQRPEGCCLCLLSYRSKR